MRWLQESRAYEARLAAQRCKELEWRLTREADCVWSPFSFSPDLKTDLLESFLNGAATFLLAPEPTVCDRQAKHNNGQEYVHTLLDSGNAEHDVHLGQCAFGN